MFQRPSGQVLRVLPRARLRDLLVGLLFAFAGLPACDDGSNAAAPQAGALGSDCLAEGAPACAGAVCLRLDSHTAYCSQACHGAADCPAGYLCLSSGASGQVCQARGAGGVCGSDNDCPAGLKCDATSARCYVQVSRSACGACTSDLQCGAGGSCHAESATESYCAPACSAAEPRCAAGYLCAAVADASGVSKNRCLPLAAGASTSTPAAGTCRGGRPLCAPCTGDLECGKPGDLCVRNLLSGETFCGTRCTAQADCPSGFGCTDLSGRGDGPSQCTPVSNTCAGFCDATDAASVRRECGLGSTCAGHRCSRLQDGTLCAACANDDDCASHVATARCVENKTAGSPFLGQKFCGSDCSRGTCPGAGCTASPSACQAGFVCVGIGPSGGWPFQCAPARGSCSGGLQRLGDSCAKAGAADCVSGVCAQLGAERRCSAPCKADGDCGDARWRCCSLAAGAGTASSTAASTRYDCSQPAASAGGLCAPVGGSFGDDCSPGSPPCAEGLCLDLGTAQLCTRACDAGQLCGAGFSCQQAALEKADGTPSATKVGVCFPDGGGVVGAACTFGPAGCKSHLCLKKDSGNLCTAACSAATAATVCPPGWSCTATDQVGGGQPFVCLPPGVGP